MTISQAVIGTCISQNRLINLINLDANDPLSYSGSGNTWSDLSGFNNHATLFNNPSFNTNAGLSYFTFDPTYFQYASAPDQGSLHRWTVEVWTRLHDTLNGRATMIVGTAFNGGNLNYSIGANHITQDGTISTGWWQNAQGLPPRAFVLFICLVTGNI
mgnify:CR=1 FL=1